MRFDIILSPFIIIIIIIYCGHHHEHDHDHSSLSSPSFPFLFVENGASSWFFTLSLQLSLWNSCVEKQWKPCQERDTCILCFQTPTGAQSLFWAFMALVLPGVNFYSHYKNFRGTFYPLQRWLYYREHLKYVWNVCVVTNHMRDLHTTETTGNEPFP